MSTDAASEQPGAFTGRTAWARNLAAPVRDFLSTETGGAAVLLCAAVAALLWANSPWSDSYESFWTTKLSIQFGDDGISEDLRHWVNEGLMTFFFLVIGLEAKRELDMGQLRERRRITIPLRRGGRGHGAADRDLPGVQRRRRGANGWGAAMSTDTAFALGVLALVAPRRHAPAGPPAHARGRRRPGRAARDRDGVHGPRLDFVPLAIAVGLFGMLLALRYAPIAWRRQAAAVLGVAIWVALFESGIDPVITGLAVGLVTSAYPPARTDLERVTERRAPSASSPRPSSHARRS